MSEIPGELSTAPEQTILCKRCNQQNPPNFKFCGSCGVSLVLMQRKLCLLCNVLLHLKTEKCQVCSAPQDSDMFDQTPLIPCINSQCKAFLVVDSTTCYQCKSPQMQYQPPPNLSPNIPPAASRDELSAILDAHTPSEFYQAMDKSLDTTQISERVSEQPAIDISGISPITTTPPQDDASGSKVSAIVTDNQLDIYPMETGSPPHLLIVPQTSVATSLHNPPGKRQCASETPEYPGKKRKTEDESDDDFGDTVIVKEDVMQQMSPSRPHDTTDNTCGIEGGSTDTCLELPLSEDSIIAPDSLSLDSNLQIHVVNISGLEEDNTEICHTVPSLAPLPDSDTASGVLLPPELSCEDHQSKDANSQTHDLLSYDTESNNAKEISIEIQEDTSTDQQNVNEAQKRKKSDSIEEPAPKKIPIVEDEQPSLPVATAPPDLILDPDLKPLKEESNQEVSQAKENKTLASQPHTTSTGDKSTCDNDDSFIGEASDTDISPVSSPIAGNQKQLLVESDGATSKNDKRVMSEVLSSEMSNNDNKSEDGAKTETTSEETQQM